MLEQEIQDKLFQDVFKDLGENIPYEGRSISEIKRQASQKDFKILTGVTEYSDSVTLYILVFKQGCLVAGTENTLSYMDDGVTVTVKIFSSAYINHLNNFSKEAVLQYVVEDD